MSCGSAALATRRRGGSDWLLKLADLDLHARGAGPRGRESLAHESENGSRFLEKIMRPAKSQRRPNRLSSNQPSRLAVPLVVRAAAADTPTATGGIGAEASPDGNRCGVVEAGAALPNNPENNPLPDEPGRLATGTP